MKGLRSTIITAIVVGLSAGSTAGASAQATTPAEFSGRFECGETLEAGVVTSSVATRHNHGWVSRFVVVEMSDPRLDGIVTYYSDFDTYPGPAFADQGVEAVTLRIDTDEGGWQGSSYGVWLTEDAPWRTVQTTVLVGDGAYDGHVAVLESAALADPACGWDVRGLIVAGELDPFPEASTVE